MRSLLLGLILLAQPAQAWVDYAPSVDAYYRGAVRTHRRLPTASTYRTVRQTIERDCVEAVSEEQLSAGVVSEVTAMARALSLDGNLDGLPADLDYPYAAVERLRGKVAPGMVWLAACQGLVSALDDPWSEFLAPDEYGGISIACGQICIETYHGPSARPRTRTRR